MKLLPFLPLLTAAAMSAFAAGDDFDKAKPGGLPAGWTGTETGGGNPKWTVEKDDTAPSKPNVLKQGGEAKYCVAVKNDASLRDGHVEVKFKPISGEEDQAAGLVWRYRDNSNYYVVRANALEGNVVLYKTDGGKRSSLDIVGRKGGYGVKAPVQKGEWGTLRVEFSGNKFAVKLNGKQLFEVEDGTFGDAGKVGVWTKADSVTLFDDFSYGGK
ncbi:MAG: DUF1080 domain-containing protein [Verrucomicrobiota bacterium]|nr:DUF1080 domain-containing protein [Verrucomicrobiota bacterium]